MTFGRLVWIGAALSLLGAGAVHAVGVPAGTPIQNSASLSADLGGAPISVTSNTTTTLVLELLDVDVTLQSATNVLVQPGATERVLAFLVTNIGNGVDTYTLGALSAGLGGDFDPVLNRIVLDDGDGIYQPGVDPDYIVGSNDPTLDANDVAADSVLVFVLNDIPLALNDGELGLSRLNADSNTGIGAPGTLLPGLGEGGVDALIGAAGGSDNDTGTYEVSTLVVSIAKSSTVIDFFGGSQPVPGATITYQLLVSIAGAGNAQALVVNDLIPANTTYTLGSLVLNGTPQTDADDTPVDESFFDSGNNRVVFGLGALPGGSPDQTIMFQVTID